MSYFVRTYNLTVGPLPSLAAAGGLSDLMRGHRDAYPHAPEILSAEQYRAWRAEEPQFQAALGLIEFLEIR